MNNRAEISFVLFFLAGVILGVGIWLSNDLKLMDPVLVMFISLVTIVSTGTILGAFPKLVPTQDYKDLWVAIAIFCLCIGTIPGIALAVKHLGIGVLMGMIAFLAAAFGTIVGSILGCIPTTIVFVAKFFSKMRRR